MADKKKSLIPLKFELFMEEQQTRLNAESVISKFRLNIHEMIIRDEFPAGDVGGSEKAKYGRTNAKIRFDFADDEDTKVNFIIGHRKRVFPLTGMIRLPV